MTANAFSSIPFWAIELIGIVILLVLDIAQTLIYKWFSPIVGKAIRDKNKAKIEENTALNEEAEEQDSDPFGDDNKEE